MESVRRYLLFAAVSTILILCGRAASADMVAYWRFDEADGPIAYDCLSTNHGIVYGAQWTTGISGSALSFDGSNDYIEVPDSAELTPLSEITVEAWIFPHDVQGAGPWARSAVIKYSHVDNQRSYILGVQYGWPIFVLSSTGGNYYILRGEVSIPLNEWTHIVGTSDGETMRVYVNGFQAPETLAAPAVIHDSPLPLYIGAYYPPYGDYRTFDGKIDEVAIHNGALSINEIEQHYENGLNGIGYLAIQVEIDIKPGSYPNAVNLGSHGLIPVAIMSSDDFDATTVDPDTVELAGAGVEVRGKSNKYMAHEEDVNEDGLIDLVVQVATENLEPGSFQDGYAVLSGNTYEAQKIEGSDEITIVPVE